MVSKIETLRLTDLTVFLRVAREFSVTGAANRLGIAKSAVSKSLTRLERHLGVKVVERSSRRVALTPAGHALRGRAESLLAEAEQLKHALRDETRSARGIVRLTASPELGARFVEKLAPRLLEQHPELRLCIKFGYAFDDLLDPDIDLALRGGQIRDERLVAHRIGCFRRVLVANADYLEKFPINRISDLAERCCLNFSSTEYVADWALEHEGSIEQVCAAGNLSLQSFTALLHAARAGLGVAQIPEFIAAEWLERGDVAHVLPGHTSRPIDVFVVHRAGQERIARVNAVIRTLRRTSWLDA